MNDERYRKYQEHLLDVTDPARSPMEAMAVLIGSDPAQAIYEMRTGIADLRSVTAVNDVHQEIWQDNMHMNLQKAEKTVMLLINDYARVLDLNDDCKCMHCKAANAPNN